MPNKNIAFAPEADTSLRFLILSLDVHHLRPMSLQQPEKKQKKKKPSSESFVLPDSFSPAFWAALAFNKPEAPGSQ